MSLANVACFVGTLYLFYFLLKCVKFVLEVLKTTFLGGNIDFRRFGEWAGTEYFDYSLWFIDILLHYFT